jgi:hypothetical protein
MMLRLYDGYTQGMSFGQCEGEITPRRSNKGEGSGRFYEDSEREMTQS